MATMMSFTALNTARRRLPHVISTHSRHVYIVVDPRKARTKPEGPKRKKKRTSRQSYRFVDKVRVQAVAGNGGKGNLSVFKIGRKHKRRPDGGHGGRGGNVIVVADPNQQTLDWTSPHIRAQSGSHGSSQERHGRDGKNLVLRVPCGVVVKRVLDYNEVWDPVNEIVEKLESDVDEENGVEYVFEMELDEDKEDDDTSNDHDTEIDLDSGLEVSNESQENDDSVATDDAVAGDDLESDTIASNVSEDRETVVLADLDKPGAHVLVARGGRGGFGNCTYAKRNGPVPDPQFLLKRAKPQEGEVAFLELELKLIADVGLVGFPNAGKSSLLAAMSRAMPEIAPYPFTTLNPLVGCIEYRDGFRVMAADVPGLVRGASQGRGRGHDFLRHLERTKALLYLVDAAGVDGRGPVDDLLTLAEELQNYGDGDMLARPSLVVANKMDLLSEEEAEAMLVEIGAAAKHAGIQFSGDVHGISAGVSGVGLASLSKSIRDAVTESDAKRSRSFEDVCYSAQDYI